MQSIVKMNEELKIRLFYVLSITAIVANTIGFISNAIIYDFPKQWLGICQEEAKT